VLLPTRSQFAPVGVELDREAADIALGVGRPALAGDRREADEEIGLLTDLGEDFGPGIFGDTVGDGEGAVGAGSLGVHPPLRYHLAVEMGELFEKPHILQELRPSRAGGHDVLIVDDRGAVIAGELSVFLHDASLNGLNRSVPCLDIRGQCV